MSGSEVIKILPRILKYLWQNECKLSLVNGLQEITLLVSSKILPFFEGLPDCYVELAYHAGFSS